MPMTDAERKRLVNQALRNARRVYRAADTAGEELERWMDRMIDRKTAVTCSQIQPGLPRWENYRDKVKATEKAMVDAILIACEPLRA